jgi:hypothetical protein
LPPFHTDMHFFKYMVRKAQYDQLFYLTLGGTCLSSGSLASSSNMHCTSLEDRQASKS